MFTFDVDGKSFNLPDLSETAATIVPGKVTFDAVMSPGDPVAQMRLGFETLLALNPSPHALAALQSLPTDKMLKVLEDWMGEPSGSSESSEITEGPSSMTFDLGSE